MSNRAPFIQLELNISYVPNINTVVNWFYKIFRCCISERQPEIIGLQNAYYFHTNFETRRNGHFEHLQCTLFKDTYHAC